MHGVIGILVFRVYRVANCPYFSTVLISLAQKQVLSIAVFFALFACLSFSFPVSDNAE